MKFHWQKTEKSSLTFCISRRSLGKLICQSHLFVRHISLSWLCFWSVHFLWFTLVHSHSSCNVHVRYRGQVTRCELHQRLFFSAFELVTGSTVLVRCFEFCEWGLLLQTPSHEHRRDSCSWWSFSWFAHWVKSCTRLSGQVSSFPPRLPR